MAVALHLCVSVCLGVSLFVAVCIYIWREREFFPLPVFFFPLPSPISHIEMCFFLVCIYMYVCMYVCIYDCIHVCVAIHVCMHTHVCKVDR